MLPRHSPTKDAKEERERIRARIAILACQKKHRVCGFIRIERDESQRAQEDGLDIDSAFGAAVRAQILDDSATSKTSSRGSRS